MPVITKDHRIQLVATRRQLTAWRRCADEEGLTLSAWLRQAAEVAELIAGDGREDRASTGHSAQLSSGRTKLARSTDAGAR